MAGNHNGISAPGLDGPAEKGTKDKILDVSIGLFAQKGFDAVTMQEIADAVGIRKASLYYHFASKDQILESVLTLPMERLNTIGQQEMETEKAIASLGVDGFMNYARDVVLTWLEAPYVEKVMRIIFVELYHNDQIKIFFTKFTDDAMTFWVSNFSIMAKQGLIRPVDPRMVAEAYLMIYIQMWFEFFLHKYDKEAGSFREKYQEHIDRHTAFLVSSVRA